MKQNTLNYSHSITYGFPQSQPEFVQSILALLTGKSSGHMERWEYGSPKYAGDPAGGSYFWAKFIETTQSYYLMDGEKSLIEEITNSGTLDVLEKIRTAVELGPGCKDALNKKTIPFLSVCTNLRAYIAVDSEISQAQNATLQIQNEYPQLNVHSFEQSFETFYLNIPRLGPTSIIMWGCTFGNLPGLFGSDPYVHLRRSLQRLNKAIASGDSLFISFDTEECKESVLEAYNQPLLSPCFLSPLHRLVRDRLVTGNFDPYKWKHESIWIPETMQCAHTIYPIEEQEFDLCETRIFIPKFKRFITNNSYKFKPETMISASREAGFNSQIYKHGSMALLMAVKP